MNILNEQSLALTVDAVNEAKFYGQKISMAERRDVARFIASRQGLCGAYGGFLFAPVEDEKNTQLTLFTGEKLIMGGGANHILGQEAWRALKLLAVNETCIRQALSAADAGMHDRLYIDNKPTGEYCCARCSIAILHNMAAVLDTSAEAWAMAAVKQIQALRDGAGRWRRFPFYYTLLALWELPEEISGDELQYVAPTCERLLKGPGKNTSQTKERRQVLLERVLSRV